MNKTGNFLLFFVAALFTGASCSHSIKIDITRKSSELNNCENVFGADLNTLKYENAILLQTGVIDTTDEQAPIPVAIVIIDKREIILKLTTNDEKSNGITQSYEGNGYKLYLEYFKLKTDHNESFFKGKFSIENKESKSVYNIEGTPCNL